jgi:hypothetical protein
MPQLDCMWVCVCATDLAVCFILYSLKHFIRSKALLCSEAPEVPNRSPLQTVFESFKTKTIWKLPWNVLKKRLFDVRNRQNRQERSCFKNERSTDFSFNEDKFHSDLISGWNKVTVRFEPWVFKLWSYRTQIFPK